MTWTIIPRGYETIVDMGWHPNRAIVTGPNHEANARLTRAAPDLLAALHDVDELCWQGLNTPHTEYWEAALYDIMDLVRAAIAKVEGA